MNRLQEKEKFEDISQELSSDNKQKKTLNKKRTVTILLSVAGITIIALVYLFFFSGVFAGESDSSKISSTYTPSPSTSSDPAPDETSSVEVLPDDSRAMPEKDPFGSVTGDGVSSIRLSGILSGENGMDTAIFTDGETSYIVGIEDSIGDSEWYLVEIVDNTAILTDGKDTITVGFEGRE